MNKGKDTHQTPFTQLLESCLAHIPIAASMDEPSFLQIDLSCNSLSELRLHLDPPGSPFGCAALHSVALSSSAMQSLSWVSFPLLRSVALNCSCLEELSFEDCNKLQDSVFASLSNATLPMLGGCPRLRVLTIKCCDSVGALQLSHRRLQALSVAGCQQLRNLRLSCPALADLGLEDCGDLEQVALKPIGVGT